MAQLILALENLHKLGWVYRELTLEDIFIREDGYIWLNGIKPCMRKKSRSNELFYDFCAKVPNIPPEMILMEGYTEAVDVWALGICTYIMMFGNHPFEGNNMKLLFQKILNGKFENTEEIPNFLTKMILTDPKERITLDEIKKDAWFKDIDW